MTEEERIRREYAHRRKKVIGKAAGMTGAALIVTVLLYQVGFQWMLIGAILTVIVAAYSARMIVEEYKRIGQEERERIGRVQDEAFRGFNIR